VSEKYNRYVSKEITIFTVSGNGVMAIGYITSVFSYCFFDTDQPTCSDIVSKIDSSILPELCSKLYRTVILLKSVKTRK